MPAPTAVTELQQRLFKRIGVELPERQASRQQQQHGGRVRGPVTGAQSRKEQRKSQRAQKKSDRYSGGKGSQGQQQRSQGRQQQQQQQRQGVVKSQQRDGYQGQQQQQRQGVVKSQQRDGYQGQQQQQQQQRHDVVKSEQRQRGEQQGKKTQQQQQKEQKGQQQQRHQVLKRELPPKGKVQDVAERDEEDDWEDDEEGDVETSLDEDETGEEDDFEGLDDEDDQDESEEEEDQGDDDNDDDDNEEGSDDDDEDEEESLDEASGSKGMSRATREQLARDDAEIAAFERKLGIKKKSKSKSLPQSFQDDGLEELFGDLGGDGSEEGAEDESLKRKRDYDDWLAAKRRKTSSGLRQDAEGEDDDDLEGSEDFDDDDDDDDDDEAFEGFGSDDEGTQLQQKTRVKENPYKAPTTGTVVAKYVPPSLRKAEGTESEAKARLQKQLQGQINRLTEANILSIVQAIEELYSKNARGDVTEMLTNIILAQMQSLDSLSDQFFVLTGGFSAAIYKVTGSSFGSHLVREVARTFGEVYETCHKDEGDPAAIRKEASNMIAFLSQLYLFGVVGCRILFDYMERFLDSSLSELNVELLLRICRVAGQSLRRDDANALKHVTTMLGAAVAKVGYANVSARTKFMIETLNDLRNSKIKARGIDSSIVSDHVARMRKRLGELKARSRRLDGLAPMGVGLADIEQADTAGKWWLVGASVPAKEGTKGSSGSKHDDDDDDDDDNDKDQTQAADLSDDEDMDFVLPDYPKKARDQGLTTVAQIAIFTAIMSAMDYENGYQRFAALGLKRDDQLEIARVLVQCVGSEADYNEYYALVGKKACSSARLRFAFQDRLWRIFRSLGEPLFADDDDAAADGRTADSERFKDGRRLALVARFYASLVADGALALPSLLKPLNLAQANQWTGVFVERFVVALLRACRAAGKGAAREALVHSIFAPAADVPSLAAGMAWFLGQRLRETELVSAEERKKLEKVLKAARAAVRGDGAAQRG